MCPAGLHCSEREVRPLHAAFCRKVGIQPNPQDFWTWMKPVQVCSQEVPQGAVPHCWEALQLAHDARQEQRWVSEHSKYFQRYYRNDAFYTFVLLTSDVIFCFWSVFFTCVGHIFLMTKSFPSTSVQVRSWWLWGLWSTLLRSFISSLAKTPSRQTHWNPCIIWILLILLKACYYVEYF